jgi:hypothetical protein
MDNREEIEGLMDLLQKHEAIVEAIKKKLRELIQT